MKYTERLPDADDFSVYLGEVICPFCQATEVTLTGMTGGAANEILARCEACRSFFYVLKDIALLKR